MGVEEMIRRWAARRLGVSVEEVVSVTWDHRDGWSDEDSGTYWPEVNEAVISLASPGRAGEVRIDCGEGFEDIPALLAEILDAGKGG